MQNKTVTLKSILSYDGLSSGYSFRGKIKHVHNGGVRIIQMKDFIHDYRALGDKCSLIDGGKIKRKYFLKIDDILFIAKGANNYALVYKGIDDTPTIASSALFVLKVNKEIASPDFVAWYINQSRIQNYFKTNEVGTYNTNINKSTLENAPIVLPSLDVQNKIAAIARLNNKEIRLHTRITELKNKLTTTQLLKIITNNEE